MMPQMLSQLLFYQQLDSDAIGAYLNILKKILSEEKYSEKFNILIFTTDNYT